MCGIAGFISIKSRPVANAERRLSVMSQLIAHRGPDGNGDWLSADRGVGLAHRRLAIIDLTEAAAQPFHGPGDRTLVFNGEIYNYLELQKELAAHWDFRTSSDTEALLASYDRYGMDATDHLRGMFSFALWDESAKRFFAARDRFGVKPFYYTIVDDVLYFASEAKALLPFLPSIETDREALAEYLTFQFPISENTLFGGIKQLPPGHALLVQNGELKIWPYWDLNYAYDESITEDQAVDHIRSLINDSMTLHLRADVPVGSYLSGGADSSLIAILAAKGSSVNRDAFHGKFTYAPGYDESAFAVDAAQAAGARLHQVDITAADFARTIEDVIYHLDYPVAGPGSFPQYMVSALAARSVKVVLGGQGGDEIFGGYARYLAGYLDHLVVGALTGDAPPSDGLSLDAIRPGLAQLKEYKPLLQQLWGGGLSGDMADRYLRISDRSADMRDEVNWSELDMAGVRGRYRTAFAGEGRLPPGSDLDAMTRFDLKFLLPALLQVEDRMSMAHGLESRVPFLDHPIAEYVARLPPRLKYRDGRLKHLLREAFQATLPSSIQQRRDKMGFPVPLKEWFNADLSDFVRDIFSSTAAKSRPFLNADVVARDFAAGGQFSRKTWGLLSLELWHRRFHDRASEFRAMV